MQQDILINWSPQETRVAVVESGAVQELHVERSLERGLSTSAYLVACLDAAACAEMTDLDARAPAPTLDGHVLRAADAVVRPPALTHGEPTWTTGAPPSEGAAPPLSRIGELWWRRLALARQVLRALGPGRWLAMSDADVVWAGGDVPATLWARQLPTGADAPDLVASQGTFPADVFRAWNATACMGLVLFRSSARVLAFLGAVLDEIHRTSDDQVAVNRLLHGLDTVWRPGPVDGALERVGETARGVPLSLGLLSLAAVPRLCTTAAQSHASPLAYHCLTPRRAPDKEAALQALGLWRADP